jgi:hypothetical protein
MRPMGSSGISPGARCAWQAPTVTKLAIGTETRSALENGQRAGSEFSGSGQTRPAPPDPPAVAPAVKLGFSVEWAFPLSSRWGE